MHCLGQGVIVNKEMRFIDLCDIEQFICKGDSSILFQHHVLYYIFICEILIQMAALRINPLKLID